MQLLQFTMKLNKVDATIPLHSLEIYTSLYRTIFLLSERPQVSAFGLILELVELKFNFGWCVFVFISRCSEYWVVCLFFSRLTLSVVVVGNKLFANPQHLVFGGTATVIASFL